MLGLDVSAILFCEGDQALQAIVAERETRSDPLFSLFSIQLWGWVMGGTPIALFQEFVNFSITCPHKSDLVRRY
jgi:hypothetical protein